MKSPKSRNWLVIALIIAVIFGIPKALSAQVDGDDTDAGITDLISAVITPFSCTIRWNVQDTAYIVRYTYTDSSTRQFPITGRKGVSSIKAPGRNLFSVEVIDRDGNRVYYLDLKTDFGLIWKSRLVPA
jgi:hypothetical protein